MSISRIGSEFPKYKTYFNSSSLDACVKSMCHAEKKGKVLYKFFHEAVISNKWKTDGDLRRTLECCISHQSSLSGKFKAKFKKVRAIFESKVKKGKEEKKAPAPQPKASSSHKQKKQKHEVVPKETPSKPVATEKPAPSPVKHAPKDGFQAFAAPYLRQFREQIAPEIAERFTGMNAQGSSAFESAMASAGAGLEEKLRAQYTLLQLQLAQQGLGIDEFGDVKPL